MTQRASDRSARTGFRVLSLLVFLLLSSLASADPVMIQDDRGKVIRLARPPERVVCLVPSITEMIFEMGAGDRVQGVTFHDLYPSEAVTKIQVGGFFSPSTEKIRALSPDILIVADLHADMIATWESFCPVIQWNCGTVDKACQIMEVLGCVFGRKKEALALVLENRKEIERIGRRVAAVPLKDRKRVFRLMGRDRMMTPGDDSFQNELIRAAGAIPPESGKNGAIVSFDLKAWKAFNPQVLYGCGHDRSIETGLLAQPGWKDVDAVRNRDIRYYPCDLTCRASTRMGVFVSCLAADLYPHLFDVSEKGAADGRRAKDKEIPLDLPWVKGVRVRESVIFDFIQKSLVIEFAHPMDLMSTLEGFRSSVTWAGNHYFPPQTWALGHQEGVEGLKRRTFSALGLDEKEAAFLFTGANMDHLAVREKTADGLKVVAFVTAGVRGNTLRASKDEGRHVEPGTINIIVLTNRCLSPGAMTRAIVTATEAKTAALQDLDIRSSATPWFHQATGTGTDNVMVIRGGGAPLENTGGHARMGELIASAVYDAVRDAVFKQNGIAENRPLYHRMGERNLSFGALLDRISCDCVMEKGRLSVDLEHLILEPRYASFVEYAMALSDAHERGLVHDLTYFNTMALKVAEDISGKNVKDLSHGLMGKGLPPVMETAFDAMVTGVSLREKP